MEQKSSLKLKLKLGNGGSSTPEPCSPAQPSADQMAEEEMDQMMSDEDGEDMQGESYLDNDDEPGSKNQSHNLPEDGSRERHKKSKKKKKKKEKERHKHKHHREKTEADEDEPSTKKLMTQHPTADKPEVSEAEIKSTLKELFEVLLQRLQKKDVQNFFASPVTDLIAPGYSTIITNPMDFGKMNQKIQDGQYTNLSEFIEDMTLICNNCMLYNQTDTVFYKAAKKLLQSGERILSTNRILAMKSEMPSLLNLSVDHLGFDIRTDVPNIDMEEGSQDSKSSDNENSQDGSSKVDSLQDEASAADILEQTEASAEEAAEKLTLKKPECTLGFLRQRKDGTTTLNFLTGCEGGDPNAKEKPISLGLLTGKLTQGSSSLHNYRDDKRSAAKPVKPLYYGTFSSFCPSYDSTFANLNKEESEMVYATYGNETAVQYAESICDFSRDCDTAMHLVDQLLNLLTHEQHSKTKSMIEEKRRLQLEEQKIHSLLFNAHDETASQMSPREIVPNINSLKSLKELGIDTAFLTTFESLEQRQKAVGSKLTENASLLASLAKEQKDRLSKPLPQDLNNLPRPSQNELSLAEKVSDGLISVARQIPPGALAPVPIVRRALGITMMPVTSEASDQIEVDIEGTSQDTVTPQRRSKRQGNTEVESKTLFPNQFQDTNLPAVPNGVDSATDKKLKEILQSS